MMPAVFSLSTVILAAFVAGAVAGALGMMLFVWTCNEAVKAAGR